MDYVSAATYKFDKFPHFFFSQITTTCPSHEYETYRWTLRSHGIDITNDRCSFCLRFFSCFITQRLGFTNINMMDTPVAKESLQVDSTGSAPATRCEISPTQFVFRRTHYCVQTQRQYSPQPLKWFISARITFTLPSFILPTHALLHACGGDLVRYDMS